MAPTAGFMTHVTCRLTAKNRDQLRNPVRSVIEYGLPLLLGRIACTQWKDAAYCYRRSVIFVYVVAVCLLAVLILGIFFWGGIPEHLQSPPNLCQCVL